MSTAHRKIHVASLAALLIAGCGGGGSDAPADPPPATPTPYVYTLPENFPQPRSTPQVPMSVASVELGRLLFYDTRMSINGKGACATCHEQRRAFTDGRVTALGPTGDVHPRNSPTLTNAVYNARLNWANPNMRDLRQQALGVLLNESTIELGWASHEDEILQRFRDDPVYVEKFRAAFPDAGDPFTMDHVARAVAAFGATLISGHSARDRHYSSVAPEPTAMNAAALRGEQLFFSERLECFHCHGGFNFAQSVVHEKSVLDAIEYRNNGLYNLPGPGAGYPLPSGNYPANNQGLYEFTGVAQDMGRFRAPTLRNIALTAPYMHDGSIATLREVIVDHYARGGRRIDSGPFAGDGAASPYRDALIVGFELSATEVEDLLAFLDSLTDWDFICDERFADPFGNIPMHENCG